MGEETVGREGRECVRFFEKMIAWFSYSVEESIISTWVNNGGLVGTVDAAMFLFTQDATSKDTLRIFESPNNLQNHVCVFHARYIEECVRMRDMCKVAVGNYVVPHHLVKNALIENQIKLPFERLTLKTTPRTPSRSQSSEQYPRANEDCCPGYTAIEDLAQSQALLRDLFIGQHGFRVSRRTGV